MPGPVWQEAVVIEVRGDGAGPVQAAVSSCNRALGAGRCWDNRSGELPRAGWHAIVSWPDETQLRARVELHERANGFRLMAEREVEFESDDTLEERYRAIGLIAAAQVVALTRVEPLPEPAADEPDAVRDAAGPPEPPRGPERAPQPKPVVASWAFEAGGLAGPGLDEGAPRVGLYARPRVELGATLFGFSTLRGALRTEADPSLAWASLGIGLGALLAAGDEVPGAALRAELVGQWVRAAAEDASAGRRDAATALRWGPLFGADLVYPARAPISAVLGGEVSLLFPKLSVELRGEDAGTEPAAAWAVIGGARLAL